MPAASALMRTRSQDRRHDCRRRRQTACATLRRHGLLDLGEYVWSLGNDGHGRAFAEALCKGCQRRFGCAVSKWTEARRQLRWEAGNVEMNLKTPSGQCQLLELPLVNGHRCCREAVKELGVTRQIAHSLDEFRLAGAFLACRH